MYIIFRNPALEIVTTKSIQSCHGFKKNEIVEKTFVSS
jgi:hypothetical protein